MSESSVLSRTPRLPAGIAALALTAVLLLLSALIPVSADAAARVTIKNEFGKAEADLTYSTQVTVSGTGFQSVKGGFGGIYVLFGWVKDGAWQPSKGGTTGNGDYLYVPDEETKDNAGYQRFVAFPGSDTEYAANGGTIAADGTWSATMYVPGPTFEAVGRDGSVSSVDCRKVTCGILTIGAHGVTNAKNETFTPIAFKSIFDSAPKKDTEAEATPTATDSATSGATSATDAASGSATVAPSTGSATIKVDTNTAMVGRVLAFTATGFVEGEQVTAVLDEGIAAVGPLTTGKAGAVAGVIQLPAQVKMGTHTLTVTGAASAKVATVNFPVKADPAAVVAPEPEPASPWWSPSWLPSWPIVLFVVLALALLIASIVWRVRGGRRDSKHNGGNRRAKSGPGAPGVPVPGTPVAAAPVAAGTAAPFASSAPVPEPAPVTVPATQDEEIVR